jgi:PAS domain S-box-containing protein
MRQFFHPKRFDGSLLKPLRQIRLESSSDPPVDPRSLIDQVPMGVVLLDADRRIVLMNRVLEALTGFTQQEAAGVPCYHILRHRICLRDCPALHMNAESEGESADSDLINRDRTHIPIKITLAPVKDMAGNLAGFLETIEDLRPTREIGANIYQDFHFGDMVSKSPQMGKILQILPALAQNDSSILITGETGTGKDRLAEAIHQASGRAKSPFIKVNCGALPETLLESELFGHRKGAFTGAVENKPGRFRMAHGGTLFLTEIGDLPLSIQIKLLTFLDDQVVYPLGSTKGFQADVRVIAATHRNLEQMVKDGRFREDLLFRLNVVRIQIPPIREREGDVRLLMDHFLKRLNSRLGKNIAGFSKKALDVLMDYPFPGNVRELQNIVEYAVNICQEKHIVPQHLPTYLTEFSVGGDQIDSGTERPSLLKTAVSAPLESSLAEQAWNDVERQMILEALVKAGGRRSRAAEILGWGRSTLWRKMKQYDM